MRFVTYLSFVYKETLYSFENTLRTLLFLLTHAARTRKASFSRVVCRYLTWSDGENQSLNKHFKFLLYRIKWLQHVFALYRRARGRRTMMSQNSMTIKKTLVFAFFYPCVCVPLYVFRKKKRSDEVIN